MSLQVIGAGFGRTGTESMKAALEILGFGPCYHMFEILPHADRVAMWRGIMRGDTPDWPRIFQGYGSTVDWPTTHFLFELAEVYPDAKLILTARDAESWYRSMEGSIFQVVNSTDDPDSLGRQLMAQVFDNRHMERDHAIAVYNAHVEKVKASFGPDRLLVHELGAGWGPLCTFLGVPVPKADYPRTNQGEGFADRVAARSGSADA